ncbi:MAG: hypothetical protein ACOY3L_11365 [Pseudomonadota bacterium]
MNESTGKHTDARRVTTAVFDAHLFQSRFYYRGWPWFRPLAVAKFDWEDRRGL